MFCFVFQDTYYMCLQDFDVAKSINEDLIKDCLCIVTFMNGWFYHCMQLAAGEFVIEGKASKGAFHVVCVLCRY